MTNFNYNITLFNRIFDDPIKQKISLKHGRLG